jgi:NAD-dependent DNA ligase
MLSPVPKSRPRDSYNRWSLGKKQALSTTNTSEGAFCVGVCLRVGDFLKMSALSGLCFAITGTLSVGRADFEELITSNGGEVAKSVTKKCTHLIR